MHGQAYMQAFVQQVRDRSSELEKNPQATNTYVNTPSPSTSTPSSSATPSSPTKSIDPVSQRNSVVVDAIVSHVYDSVPVAFSPPPPSSAPQQPQQQKPSQQTPLPSTVVTIAPSESSYGMIDENPPPPTQPISQPIAKPQVQQPPPQAQPVNPPPPPPASRSTTAPPNPPATLILSVPKHSRAVMHPDGVTKPFAPDDQSVKVLYAITSSLLRAC
jgi:hypothetical protein